MAKEDDSAANLGAANPNTDNFPGFVSTLRRILQEAEFPNDIVERLEVRTLRNGEAVYRYWGPADDEPTGGYLSAE